MQVCARSKSDKPITRNKMTPYFVTFCKEVFNKRNYFLTTALAERIRLRLPFSGLGSNSKYTVYAFLFLRLKLKLYLLLDCEKDENKTK